MNDKNDLLLEKRLKELSPQLTDKYSKILKSVNDKLELYCINFPDYSDHSLLHSQRVVYYSNILYSDIINDLNADEIFLYLIACCTHDLGMGIDKQLFINEIDKILNSDLISNTNFFLTDSVIRKYHNFISAYILRNDEELEKILNKEYIDIIAKLCIAHREVDLYNKKFFPEEIKLSNGNSVRLTLLACMIRLADNLDVGVSRINKTTDLYFRVFYFSAMSLRVEEITCEKIILTVDISMVPLNKNTEIDALFEEFSYCKKAFLDLCNYTKLPETINLKIVYDKENKKRILKSKIVEQNKMVEKFN